MLADDMHDADCKIDGDVEVHETEEEALLVAPTR